MHYSPRPRRHGLWKRHIECGVCGRSDTHDSIRTITPDTSYLVHSSEWAGASVRMFSRASLCNFPAPTLSFSHHKCQLEHNATLSASPDYNATRNAHVNCCQRGRCQSKILRERVERTAQILIDTLDRFCHVLYVTTFEGCFFSHPCP